MLARRQKLFLSLVPLVVLPVVGSVAYFSVPPKPGITRETFRRLTKGITQERVEAILGENGGERHIMVRLSPAAYVDQVTWRGSEGTIMLFITERGVSGGGFLNKRGEYEMIGENPGVLEVTRSWVKDRTGW